MEENLNHIRARMKQRGMSQHELADKLGVSRISVNRFLNNKSSMSAAKFMGICNILEIKILF